MCCFSYQACVSLFHTPDVKAVQSRRQVEQTQERVNRALMEHTQRSQPGHSDKFGQLLLRLPEVRSISLQVEEYLYQRHLQGDLPCNSLLTEMLHTKHSWEDTAVPPPPPLSKRQRGSRLLLGNQFLLFYDPTLPIVSEHCADYPTPGPYLTHSQGWRKDRIPNQHGKGVFS